MGYYGGQQGSYGYSSTQPYQAYQGVQPYGIGGIDANVDSASDLDSPGADASINGDANADGNLPSPAGNAGGGVEAGSL